MSLPQLLTCHEEGATLGDSAVSVACLLSLPLSSIPAAPAPRGIT